MTCGMGASTAMIYTDALFGKKCAKIWLERNAVRKNLFGAERFAQHANVLNL